MKFGTPLLRFYSTGSVEGVMMELKLGFTMYLIGPWAFLSAIEESTKLLSIPPIVSYCCTIRFIMSDKHEPSDSSNCSHLSFFSSQYTLGAFEIVKNY